MKQEKNKPIKEKDIENAILDYLSFCRGTYWKNNSVGVYDSVKKTYRRPSRFHRNGVSDICGVLPCGTAVFIEVKTPKGRLSENQKKFLKDMQDNNALAFVARSVDDVRETPDKKQSKSMHRYYYTVSDNKSWHTNTCLKCDKEFRFRLLNIDDPRFVRFCSRCRNSVNTGIFDIDFTESVGN